MVHVDLGELGLAPVEHEDAGKESWSSLNSHLGDLLHDLHVGILEHWSHDLLFEGRKVLGHLAIDLIVLFPQLFYRS